METPLTMLELLRKDLIKQQIPVKSLEYDHAAALRYDPEIVEYEMGNMFHRYLVKAYFYPRIFSWTFEDNIQHFKVRLDPILMDCYGRPEEDNMAGLNLLREKIVQSYYFGG